jgi:hypothetical protein
MYQNPKKISSSIINCRNKIHQNVKKCETEGKFLGTKFEFGGSFGMSLEGDSNKLEVTPNLEFLITFGVYLEGFVMSFIPNFPTSSYLIWR